MSNKIMKMMDEDEDMTFLCFSNEDLGIPRIIQGRFLSYKLCDF